MGWFEIVYSGDPFSEALRSEKVTARNRIDAAAAGMRGFPRAHASLGATCYRVLDGLGQVVARGPKQIT